VRVLYLAPLQQEARARELAEAVESQLSDLRARLRLAWSAPVGGSLDAWLRAARQAARSEQAAAVFWTRQQRLYVAFVDRAGQELRLLIRGLGQARASERAEAVALILRAALSAYLRGARLPAARRVTVPAAARRASPRAAASRRRPGPASSRAPSSSSSSPSSSPSPSSSSPSYGARPRLALALGYVLDAWSDAAPANHGLGVSLAVRLGHGVWLRLAARWVPPMTLEPVDAVEEPARAHLQRIPLLLAAGYHHRWGRWSLGVELGVQAEYLRATLAPADRVQTAADRGDLRWALVPAGTLA
jgi:hypothetical protein